jgi:DNA-binding NarL/FixJ family response regulator
VTKILIADDNEPVRRFLKTVLSQHSGWSICGEAANGRQAVLMAIQLKPDLIILDLSMPMLNGIEAAAEILKITPTVSIVLYTLHKNSQLDLKAKMIGVRKVISKTDDQTELIAGLEELLGHGSTSGGPLGVTGEYSVELTSSNDAIAEPQTKPNQTKPNQTKPSPKPEIF